MAALPALGVSRPTSVTAVQAAARQLRRECEDDQRPGMHAADLITAAVEKPASRTVSDTVADRPELAGNGGGPDPAAASRVCWYGLILAYRSAVSIG
jgi:hypothetical protein